jgi:hypothetical protein
MVLTSDSKSGIERRDIPRTFEATAVSEHYLLNDIKPRKKRTRPSSEYRRRPHSNCLQNLALPTKLRLCQFIRCNLVIAARLSPL